MKRTDGIFLTNGYDNKKRRLFVFASTLVFLAEHADSGTVVGTGTDNLHVTETLDEVLAAYDAMLEDFDTAAQKL